MTVMTEEIATATTSPAPLGRVKYHYNRPPREAGSGPSPSPRRPTLNQTQGETMQTKEQLDAHCRRAGCRCDHLDCYQGWNIHDESTAAPCQYCRPSTHERLWKAQAARAKGYPLEAVHRILRTVDHAKP